MISCASVCVVLTPRSVVSVSYQFLCCVFVISSHLAVTCRAIVSYPVLVILSYDHGYRSEVKVYSISELVAYGQGCGGCAQFMVELCYVSVWSLVPRSVSVLSEVEGGENYAIFPRLTGKSISISIRSCVPCVRARRNCARA